LTLLSLIAAMDRNRLIGSDNRLPWRLPADLAHFKKMTLGKPIVMGRRTFESIGRPLPGRTNIVLTRSSCLTVEGVLIAGSLDDALDLARGAAEVMVIGGGKVYEQALPQARRLYLTLVDGVFEGDSWFPEIDSALWREVDRSEHRADQQNPHDYSFVTLEKITPEK
jgi:dihydrofolate reductase